MKGRYVLAIAAMILLCCGEMSAQRANYGLTGIVGLQSGYGTPARARAEVAYETAGGFLFGAGIEANYYWDVLVTPYVDARMTFNDFKVAPFASLNLGYAIGSSFDGSLLAGARIHLKNNPKKSLWFGGGLGVFIGQIYCPIRAEFSF